MLSSFQVHTSDESLVVEHHGDIRLSAAKDDSQISLDISFCLSPSAWPAVNSTTRHTPDKRVNEERLERLEKQHAMLRQVLGNYPPILAKVMADDASAQRKACLDLGCGSGGWIIEVARHFPNCSALALDLFPMQSTSMPPNCRSEVDDINLGLEHLYGQFNVVHARLLSAGIKDFRNLINQITQILRPSGLLILAELDFHVYDGNKQRFKAGTSTVSPHWWARWMEFANMAIRQRGGNPEVSSYMAQWVRGHDSLDNVTCKEYWIPASPWVQGSDTESVRQRCIGQLMRKDIMALVRSSRPLLLGSGLLETLVTELEDNAIRELMDAKLPQYLRMQVVHALKLPKSK